MTGTQTRRAFLAQNAVAGSALAAAWHVNPKPAAASNSSLERLNIAAIGTGNRAAGNISGCASQNIVALADVDSRFLEAAGGKYKGARRYRDFRVLLESEEETLEKIEFALERIESGLYGRCQECESIIPKTRLNAIPYTPVCVKCAEEIQRS